MSKRDDVGLLYKKSKHFRRTQFYLYLADVVLSFYNAFIQYGCEEGLVMLQILVALLYMCCSIIDDGSYWYQAEKARRKYGIQNAYKLTFDIYETEGYYNNGFEEPEIKYAVNLFESNFYSKIIGEKMQFYSIIKSLVAIMVFLISFKFIQNNQFLLVVSQVTFSVFVLKETSVLFFYVIRLTELFNEAYTQFVTVGISKPEQLVWLRYYCTEYECIKAYYKVRLDETLFNEINADLSEQWKVILAKIKIENL